MKTILMCRHAQAAEDGITSFGAMQAHGIGKKLEHLMLYPDCLVYGGNACRQTALVIASVAVKRFFFEVKMDETTSFLPSYPNDAIDILYLLNKNKATVKRALEENEYVRRNRARLIRAMVRLAADMSERKEEIALVVSHSFFAELAADKNDIVPFGLNEADCLVYTIDEKAREIKTCQYIECVYPSHSAYFISG